MARQPEPLSLTAVPAGVCEDVATSALARATEILLRIERRTRWGSAAPQEPAATEENRAA